MRILNANLDLPGIRDKTWTVRVIVCRVSFIVREFLHRYFVVFRKMKQKMVRLIKYFILICLGQVFFLFSNGLIGNHRHCFESSSILIFRVEIYTYLRGFWTRCQFLIIGRILIWMYHYSFQEKRWSTCSSSCTWNFTCHSFAFGKTTRFSTVCDLKQKRSRF